jgi:DNA replication and repair protein RecF
VTLQSLRIQSFRCLEQVELALHPERNYLYGPNASGKTSVLEAAHFLSRGRSFRTRRNRTVVRHGCEALAVSGNVELDGIRHRLGAALGSGGLQLRVDGEDVGAAETTRLLPVQVIDPEVHRLIDGGPESRRRYLDWGVFHVEHDYLGQWRKFRRVLGQRNAALKAAQGDVTVWTQALAESGEAVNEARHHYVSRLAAPSGPRPVRARSRTAETLPCLHRG